MLQEVLRLHPLFSASGSSRNLHLYHISSPLLSPLLSLYARTLLTLGCASFAAPMKYSFIGLLSVICVTTVFATVGDGNTTRKEACLARMYPQSAGFFGSLGVAVALIFANLGSAYGAAKSGVGLAQLGLLAPEKIMRGIVPVVMAGILGIYGLIVAVIINNNIKTELYSYSTFSANLHLGAGMAAGLASLAAGLSIGVVGDTTTRAYGKQDQVFVAMVLMLIFSEALGLYGLIIALLMNNQANRYTGLCDSS